MNGDPSIVVPKATSETRISIVMITHNRASEVVRSLSFLKGLGESWPIVLVDNGSTDGTIEAVRAQFPPHEVGVLALGENHGAAARTLGVQHVRTPYVAFCDDDAWWQAGSLARAVELFDAHPRLALITGRILVGPEEREDPICQELRESPLPDEPGLPGYPLLGFLAGASIVRSAAFLQAGGFDRRFMIGGEEELLALDLAAQGWKLRYVPAIVLHHHPSSQRDVRRRRWYMVRNALWSAWLRRPLGSAIERTLWQARLAREDRILLRSFTAALAGLPWVLRSRRVVPPEIERSLRLLENTAARTRV